MLLALGLTSCEKDEIKSESVITVDSYQKNAFDKWLEVNFVNPYNIDFKYRYEEIESDYNYYTVPANMDNAIVIYENEQPQENIDNLCDYLGIPRMDATKLGYLQHKPLTWENECTRHKLLDIIGDMALIGKPPKGRIIATRPGHTINNKFARLLRKEIRKHEIQAPIYDPNEAPVMDVNKIRELLPHRYPMQLVDKVIKLGPSSIVGVKNVTSNEPFFQGHFPEEPVMPGVLLIEAMAQCGGLLVLNTVEEPERWSTYFLKIDNVKFRQKVVPGDTLLFKVDLLAPLRHGISSMRGYIFVGDNIVAEATFTAQIIKNK